MRMKVSVDKIPLMIPVDSSDQGLISKHSSMFFFGRMEKLLAANVPLLISSLQFQGLEH